MQIWHKKNLLGYAYDTSGADQGWGLRASRNAKMVISSARATKAVSRRTVLRVNGSGVAKQPQLMSMCNKYARVTTPRNPTMISVTSEAQIRRRQPISKRIPRR